MSQILSNREIRRYQNQIDIEKFGIEGQEKLKETKVVVIGAGGVGTVVLQHLTSCGIGTLGIIDNSMVEETNIHRQTLYGTSDLGKQKAIITKQKLSDLNAQCKINIHNLFITAENLYKICELYDIIIDVSNNSETNNDIIHYCVENNKPLVFGIINEFEIEVGSFSDSSKLNEYAQKRISNEIHKSGYISSIAGIVGSLICLHTIKMVIKFTDKSDNQSKKINILELL